MLEAVAGLVQADAVYALPRAFILGILVSSEGLLARRRRVRFERPLVLFGASALMMAGEVCVILASLFAWGDAALLPPGTWVWPTALSTLGLLSMAFCFDLVTAADDREVRLHSRRYLVFAGFFLSTAVLVTGLRFPASRAAPSSQGHLGFVAILFHGARAFAMLLLLAKVRGAAGTWFSTLESRVFTAGCLLGMAGAFLAIYTGPREHLTTFAYTLFVAVIQRDAYRRTEMEAVRAAEDRSTKMLLFHRITTQLKSSFDLGRLYEILMDSLFSNLGAESGAIYVKQDPRGNLRPAYVRGPFPPPAPLPGETPQDPEALRRAVAAMEIPPGVGIAGKVAQKGVPVYIFDPADARRHYTWDTGVAVRTAIALPLRSQEGVYGVVMLVNRAGGGAFTEEDLRFMSLLVEQTGLAIYNARLYAEHLERQRTDEQIKIAREIQLHLVPTRLPEIGGLEIGAEYSAAQEVGGDYYDIYRIDHDHVGFVVFDVAGKGVPGALLMAITATFLKMAAPRSQSPAWVLNEVNAALNSEMRRGLYVTALYAVIRPSTGEVTLCSAGHPDAIVIRRDGRCERHNPRGAALGLLAPNRFRLSLDQEVFVLEPGDTLLMYTDGVIEARDAQGREFGDERLLRVARQNARHGPRALAREIIAAVRGHTGDQPPYDDVTVLAVRRSPDRDQIVQ